jgi:hypothetical protein
MTLRIADAKEGIMQTCGPDSPYLSTGKAPVTPCANPSPERHAAAGLQKSACNAGSELAQYLQEDLAQTLCAVKFELEGLSHTALQGAELATSIAALHGTIRQLLSLAAEIRRTPAADSATAYAQTAGGNRLNLARVRTRAFGKAHQPSAKLAVDFSALLGA